MSGRRLQRLYKAYIFLIRIWNDPNMFMCPSVRLCNVCGQQFPGRRKIKLSSTNLAEALANSCTQIAVENVSSRSKDTPTVLLKRGTFLFLKGKEILFLLIAHLLLTTLNLWNLEPCEICYEWCFSILYENGKKFLDQSQAGHLPKHILLFCTTSVMANIPPFANMEISPSNLAQAKCLLWKRCCL